MKMLNPCSKQVKSCFSSCAIQPNLFQFKAYHSINRATGHNACTALPVIPADKDPVA